MPLINKFFVCLFILSAGIFAQESDLYIPLDIQKAYKNTTRSMDGKPGSNYWQNKSEYTIDVKIYPLKRLIKGNEKITYFNNSPDTLKNIIIKINQDLYKIGNLRDRILDKAALHEGTQICLLKINDSEYDMDAGKEVIDRQGTNLNVKLKEPLPPQNKANLEINWSFIVPDVSLIRAGAYKDTSFFMAYWFPQIAVYDDINGWDKIDYSGTVETYNDFSDFDVKISAPSGYTVWATGVLQNPDKVLPQEQLKLYHKAHKTEEIINIITKKDYKSKDFKMNPDGVKWHFKAQNVPDFAFSVAKNYLWDATSLELDNKSVFISAAYRKTSKDFYDVADIAQKTIKFLSTEFPAVTFPYPEMTVFNGHGGMEFPMMINDGTTKNYGRTIGLTSHEITHTYFPFFMGINERKYAWMDEGWAVMLPFDFQENKDAEYVPKTVRINRFKRLSGKEIEQPPMTPSFLLHGYSYRVASYGRPGFAYLFLREMLGDDLFLKAMHGFMDRWNGKHPIPYDFFFSFENIVGEDLSWYWKPWFFERGYADLGIKDVKIQNNEVEIFIKKQGNIPIPLQLTITYADDSEESIRKNADIWKGKTEFIFKTSVKKEIKKIKIGHIHIPDAVSENNVYMVKS